MSPGRARDVDTGLVGQNGYDLGERDDGLSQQGVRSVVLIALFLHPQCERAVQVDTRKVFYIERRADLLDPI